MPTVCLLSDLTDLQFSGTLNLIVTTWEIKNWGLRTAIINQTFWPALRNLTQIYASASRVLRYLIAF
jgi:hypothetical protein